MTPEITILNWLQSKPNGEECELAIEEARYLLHVLYGMGGAADFVANLKKVIEWAWTANHLPLEIIEAKLMMSAKE